MFTVFLEAETLGSRTLISGKGLMQALYARLRRFQCSAPDMGLVVA
jgi:hypothetical protein